MLVSTMAKVNQLLSVLFCNIIYCLLTVRGLGCVGFSPVAASGGFSL